MSLDNFHIKSYRTPVAFLDFKFYRLVGFQSELRIFNPGTMNKDVISVFSMNESETFDTIIPFYFANHRKMINNGRRHHG